MTTFNSPEIVINKKAKDFFHLISNMENLKSLLPDEIEDFQSSENTPLYETSVVFQNLKIHPLKDKRFSNFVNAPLAKQVFCKFKVVPAEGRSRLQKCILSVFNDSISDFRLQNFHLA